MLASKIFGLNVFMMRWNGVSSGSLGPGVRAPATVLVHAGSQTTGNFSRKKGMDSAGYDALGF